MDYTITINDAEMDAMKEALTELGIFYSEKAVRAERNGWSSAEKHNEKEALCNSLCNKLEACRLMKTTDNFINDSEKMLDFLKLNMDEFLASYSYLTEEEYRNTALIWRYLS